MQVHGRLERRRGVRWWALVFGGLVVAVWLWPSPKASFDQLYAEVDPASRAALKAFRMANPPRRLAVGGAEWEYVALGEGPKPVLFLHGMTGAYDIWWQQLEALRRRFRVVSITYPAVRTLEEMAAGVTAVLNQEGVSRVAVVGTSLGGYLAQYLVGRNSERIPRVVLGNTFPPNDVIASRNRAWGSLLPYLPEWAVLAFFRRNFRQVIYPTSGGDPLTLAFLNELVGGRMRKAQVLARYSCLIQKFAPPDPQVPILIIESDNDPLIDPSLRRQLRATYARARVYTFRGAGHFPYLNRAEQYNRVLAEFLSGL